MMSLPKAGIIVAVAFFTCAPVMAQDATEPTEPTGPTEPVDTVSGLANVIDADVIRIGQQRVILWGIDAPEKNQNCYRDGVRWGCHDAAYRLMETLSGRGEVTCFLTGEPDPFNRRFGVCESGGEDLNAAMVSAGMALAYTDQTDEYVEEQIDAITDENGVWQLGVEFEEPWVYRRMHNPGGYR